MRVGLDHHAVWAVRYASRVRWSPSSREARRRQIEAPPKKMHRALFAREAAAESLQHPLRASDNLPTAMSGNRIVERVFTVPHEWYGDLHFDRRGDDRRLDRERAQAAHIQREELGHGHRGQRKGFLGTATGPQGKLV